MYNIFVTILSIVPVYDAYNVFIQLYNYITSNVFELNTITMIIL